MVKRAIRTGESIVRDGIKRFYAWEPVFDSSMGGGSAGYTWHNDGNRALHQLVEKTADANGKLTTRIIKIGYRSL